MKILSRTARVLALLTVMIHLAVPDRLLAWGEKGHQTVGSIADQIIAGTHAEREVHKLLLPGETFMSVSIWADCAKGYCHAPWKDEDHDHLI